MGGDVGLITALALVDVMGVFTSEIGFCTPKIRRSTYSDFPVTYISVLRIWPFDLAAPFRKSSVGNGSNT